MDLIFIYDFSHCVLPDGLVAEAPSSPEESDSHILCFFSASAVLTSPQLSSALPVVFLLVVPQTLSPFLAVKHCIRWLQAPGFSSRCNIKSWLETCYLIKCRWEFFFLVRANSTSTKEDCEVCAKQKSRTGQVILKNIQALLQWNFSDNFHWNFQSWYVSSKAGMKWQCIFWPKYLAVLITVGNIDENSKFPKGDFFYPLLNCAPKSKTSTSWSTFFLQTLILLINLCDHW